jgi:hypothetical protein
MGYKPKSGHHPYAQEANLRAGARPARSARVGARERPVGEPDVAVVDNLPGFIPVTQREIEVIETYLGALLGAVLASTEGETRDTNKLRENEP